MDAAEKCQQRVCLLLGQPGIGKTSFLCGLAEKQREEAPHMWAVVVKLLDHVKILAELPDGNAMEQSDVARLLAAAAGVAAPASSAARRSLEAALFHSGAVHVFVDGVDEVLPGYRGKTLRMLELLVKETKAERVWVAARPQVEETLRLVVPFGPCFLMPLSKEEQLDYLQSKWLFADQRQDFFERVGKQLLDAYAFTPECEQKYSTLHSQLDQHSFLGVPFNLDLVIEVYTEDARKAIENNSTFLPRKVSLLQLVQQSIQTQRERYKDRYGIKSVLREITYSSKAEDDVFISLHQNYAMLIWTSSTVSSCQKMFQESVENFREYVTSEKSGILWQLEDGSIKFAHYTFVEYFVATWLFKMVSQSDVKQSARATSDCNLRQLVETAYKNPQSRVMVFLDLMLAEEEYPLHKAILENDTETLAPLLSKVLDQDLGGRTALHVAAAYGRSGCVNSLLEAGSDLSKCDSLLQWTPLKYASATASLRAAEILLEKGANPKDLKQPVDIMEVLIFDLVRVLQVCLGKKKGRSRFDVILINCAKSVTVEFVLCLAARAGSKRVVQLLIDSGAKVNFREPTGDTPLHAAAFNGHKEIAKSLLSARAVIDYRGMYDLTPLHYASGEGQIKLVRFLLSKGANIFAKGVENLMPIHVAARNGHKVVVKLLIKKAKSKNDPLHANSPDIHQRTPLHWAAEYGHEEVAETLIQNGANIYAKTTNQDTALHFSALYGHEKVTEVILQNRADIECCGQRRFTALHHASLEGQVNVVRLLLSKGADVFKKGYRNLMPIHVAAKNGHKAVVELLIQSCPAKATLQVNSPDECNNTPLHFATDKGQKEVIEILIRNGANISVKTGERLTPIHISALNGDAEVTEVLLRCGADVNCHGKDESTPLHCACQNGHTAVVELLLKAGAVVDSFEYFGRTPLFHAVRGGHLNIVKSLLSRGADVTRADRAGVTPLHVASGHGRSLVVATLLHKGARVNAIDIDGQSALHSAALNGHKEVVQLLLSRGADPSLVDNEGYLPITLAIFQNFHEVEDILRASLRDNV